MEDKKKSEVIKKSKNKKNVKTPKRNKVTTEKKYTNLLNVLFYLFMSLYKSHCNMYFGFTFNLILNNVK